ncbi:MAG TPA: hypothetical protein VFY82_12120 [Acidimicrobiales bacterium]|nr:hypothetical protein [Acidimicrobiales bacterium]
MTDLAPRTVGDLAADRSGAASAVERAGFDDWCRRKRSPLDTCAAVGLDPDALAEFDTHRHIHRDDNVLFPAAFAALDSFTSAACGPDEEART